MNGSNRRPAVVQPGDGRRFNLLGQTITVKLSSAETGGAYYLFENDVPPGARIPEHLHSLEDEILEVLDGELELFLGGEIINAPAGTIAFFPKRIVHGFRNPRNIPAKGRFLVTPAANFEKFFGELSAFATRSTARPGNHSRDFRALRSSNCVSAPRLILSLHFAVR